MDLDLNTAWFVLVMILLTGYAVLDGFDLGTGLFVYLAKTDDHRRLVLNSIGPIWNGNEVWLVTGGGALFAAFPNVYATVFSGFYDAFMLLLFALIFRAVAIEFRSQRESPRWRRGWDIAFAVASLTTALLLGVAVGNIAIGIPLDAQREYHGGLLGLLNPYAIGVGVVALSLFIMHANLYLVLKTEGDLQAQLIRATRVTVPVYVGLFVLLNVATLFVAPHVAAASFGKKVALGVIFLTSIAVTFNILRQVRRGNDGWAFLSSAGSIVTLMALFAVSLYPRLVPSRPDLVNSLTIWNGSSTTKSLGFMFVVALIGIPFVLAYTASIYYVFRGKVKLGAHSY